MFSQKRIWITGASSGIGQALAQVLAEHNAQLILSARREDALKKVQQSLKNAEQHQIVVMDVCDEQQVQDAVQQVFKHGKLNMLINNAGISQRALIAETTMDTERKIMEIDYFAQVHLSKLVLPYFVAQQSGHVVFISSIAGLLGTQYRASYSAAKAAIHLWANSCRAEYAEQGIDVSVIFPGFVQTNVSLNALNGVGEAQNHQDDAIQNGLSAINFAQQVIKALAQKQQYIVLGGKKEQLGVWLSRLSPQTLYKMIRKIKVK